MKILKIINSRWIFAFSLALILTLFIYWSAGNTIFNLSSDVWMYQYTMIQQHEDAPWSEVPAFYTQGKLYLAFPIIYGLSPGFSKGVFNYKIATLFLIAAIFIASGLVVKKVFNSWFLGALAGWLAVWPRNIYPTRIGIIGIGNFRGVAFSFIFYFLLSYYWIIYGLKNRRKNIYLAVLAGASVYLYPPFGLMIIPMFVLTALWVHKKQYLKEIIIFSAVVFIVVAPFFYANLTDGNALRTVVGGTLTPEDRALQAKIIDYRIADISFFDTDFGVVKRAIWDGAPLVILFLISLFLWKRSKSLLSDDQKLFFKISVCFSIIFFLAVGCVEVINGIVTAKGFQPIFIEHVRMMRAIGYVLVAQAILALYILYSKFNKKALAGIFGAALVLAPISLAAPMIRMVVRAVVPVEIREKYNLAPIIAPEDLKDFKNLESAALWARESLSHEGTKVFAFAQGSEDFQFKVLSRLNTNLTVKEGSAWVTSTFENSKRWYEERRRYDEIVGEATDFSEIISFARELGSTHMLLPRGKYSEMYEHSAPLPVLYENPDYQVLEL